MKRTATSASQCLERIRRTSVSTYSTTIRQSKISQRDIPRSTPSSQQTCHLTTPLRPATASTRPATTIRSPARRAYTSTQTQHSSEPSSQPPPNTHTREDVKAAPKTHYSLFPKTLSRGPPPNGPFSIDLNALKREFLQLQALAHPDRHQGPQKLRAEAASSAINEAYKTLQDPLRRANYLLELKGWETEECDKMGGEFTVPGHGSLHPGSGPGAAGGSGELGGGMGEGSADASPAQDMELLMSVMEAREAVEDAETEEEVAALKEENEERIKESIGVLEDAFSKDDLGRAKRESVRLRYWRNIGESLHEWEGKGSMHTLQH